MVSYSYRNFKLSSTTYTSHFNNHSIPAHCANYIGDENQTPLASWSPDGNEETQVNQTYRLS